MKMKRAYPVLEQYEEDWVVMDMLSVYLKNKHDAIKKRVSSPATRTKAEHY